MSKIQFSQLVDSLPRGDSLRAKSLPIGFRYTDQSNPRFIEPELEVIEPVQAGVTSVVLVSAPGAVGKSTLAAELSARTGAPLWDLSRLQVGSRTFSGTILEAYEFEATGVLKRLRDGDFLFVLDALDEAQVRAGSNNFDEFIANVAAEFKDSKPNPCIVLLARSDTADWVHLILDEGGVPLARYQIAYFDEPRAISFVRRRLDQRRSDDGHRPLHREQVQPFDEARSRLFELVYRLFSLEPGNAWDDERVCNFLGYAPVLEALTDYLDVQNYMAFLQELAAEEGALTDPWNFLSDVVNRLLAREQSKIVEAVRPSMEGPARSTGWDDWDHLYEPSEQCARVLGKAVDHAVDAVGDRLPTDLRNAYEDAVSTIFTQHPFLAGRRFANVVFKEYIYAWGIVEGNDGLIQALRGSMLDRDSPFLPSPLFSRFVAAFADDDEAVLDGQDFGVLYESLLSRVGASAEEVTLTIVQSGPEAFQASVTLNGEGGAEISYQVLDTGSGVHVWRRLANADVHVTGAAVLGLNGQRFTIGPSVRLTCGPLETRCEHLEVDATDDVRIEAADHPVSAQNFRLSVRNESQGAFSVCWPQVAHPWAAYRGEKAVAPALLSETARGEVLRKFLLMFRRQRTRKRATVAGARWSQEQLAAKQELLDLALARGVLKPISGIDVLEFSSQYASLKTLLEGEAALSEPAETFVREYLGREQAERILARG